MRHHEYEQIRGFIDTNSDYARANGLAFQRCQIRDLDTLNPIETIKLTVSELDSWSVDEARRRYNLPSGHGRRERYIGASTMLAALRELRVGQ